MKQRTLKSEVELSGIGLHTGQEVTVTFKPAEANSGIKFIRVDLDRTPFVMATAESVTSTQRSTTIAKRQASVQTVEHALAALAGLQIDNVDIEINGAEMPILDGSAKPFVDAFRQAGIEELKAERDVFEIDEVISVKDEETGAEITVFPADRFEVTTLVDYNSPYISTQYASMTDIEQFEKEIAPCRTFAFLDEVEMLLDKGLIKGGSLDNAVVIANKAMSEDELSSLAKKLDRPAVAISQSGVLNTTELKFPNEPARHKLLDVIGDLSLIGVSIKGKVVATKPGHKVNTEIAKIIREKYKKHLKLGGLPKYDPTKEPVKNTLEVEAMLPHRHPFLLVDKIIELNEKRVVGIKNVTYDEYFFNGHFPGNPVMPGVLQIEAMAQTGGILALNMVEDPHNWDTYFIKIDEAKFKAKVLPGDTLIMKLELLKPIRRGMVIMQGTAYVGDKIVSEGQLTAQIVRRNVEE